MKPTDHAYPGDTVTLTVNPCDGVITFRGPDECDGEVYDQVIVHTNRPLVLYIMVPEDEKDGKE